MLFSTHLKWSQDIRTHHRSHLSPGKKRRKWFAVFHICQTRKKSNKIIKIHTHIYITLMFTPADNRWWCDNTNLSTSSSRFYRFAWSSKITVNCSGHTSSWETKPTDSKIIIFKKISSLSRCFYHKALCWSITLQTTVLQVLYQSPSATLPDVCLVFWC